MSAFEYALIALGSNIGDRQAHIDKAIDKISIHNEVVLSSDFYENPSQEGAGGDDFYNAAVLIKTQFGPKDLLADLFNIETEIDPEREMRGRKFARIIDLDILLFGDKEINEASLEVPHPRMHLRDFVMLPLENLLQKISGKISISKIAEEKLALYKSEEQKRVRDLMQKKIKGFDFNIRRMYLEDLDRVVELDPVIFGKVHWTRNIFTNELANPNAIYYVAENDGKVCGYIGTWIVLDEMHILTLGVDPEMRRKKIAEHLLLAVMDSAYENKIRALTLEVRESNIAAQKLYGKYGFQKHGLRKNYYEDNRESAVLLWTPDIDTCGYLKLLSNSIQLQQPV